LNIRSSFSYLVLLAVLLSVTTMARAEKEVFRWVDENGVVYFSDRPLDPRAEPTGLFYEPTDPQQVAKQLMREEYAENKAKAAAAEQAETDAEEATRLAEEARTRDLQCNAARERLNVYTTAPRLYETLPGGERRYLTDDELTTAREQAKADVKQWCN
jgi:hypothetical protein